ncbi:hypothetical protein E4U42_000882 [Claviceps africana]|uniref:Uncharacterized protein n=1 Tax=Claviceps africana TaxID=83212 RepID=A0A8K0J196_9HYPO|nr:hypothetical protein E4U42_000882 [Claviceps africana]
MKFTAMLSGAVLLALEVGQAIAAPRAPAERIERCCGRITLNPSLDQEYFNIPWDGKQFSSIDVWQANAKCHVRASFVTKDVETHLPPSKGGCAHVKFWNVGWGCDNDIKYVDLATAHDCYANAGGRAGACRIIHAVNDLICTIPSKARTPLGEMMEREKALEPSGNNDEYKTGAARPPSPHLTNSI